MAKLVPIENPADTHRLAILTGLADFNAQNGYPGDGHALGVLLTDDAGQTRGGLWGRTSYDWLFVEFLFVPAALRGEGLGERMMKEAETIAIERGCVGAWLTTFIFQARGFYEKLGYETFGALDNCPRDNVRLFMRKRLDRV